MAMLALFIGSWYKLPMKLFLALLFLAVSYMVFLFHTTDTVLSQTTQLNNTYQNVANHADELVSVPSASAQEN
jgi:hypothetical protein